MKVILYHFSTKKEKWSEIFINQYIEKIGAFQNIEIQSLKPGLGNRHSQEQRIEQEALVFLSHLKSDDFFILFDEFGKANSSIQWAKDLQKILNSGKKRSVLLIGGPYGVSKSVKTRAQLTLSLAPFVMNHLVAQAVALEQWYRAWTILKNQPYHNGTEPFS